MQTNIGRRVALELREATDDHWYWLARYELDPDGWSGPLPELIVLVLMDGTVVRPRIFPERKYMYYSSGALGVSELGYFSLQGATLTDAGLAQLQGMHSLESILLDSAQVTDTGLEHIGGLIKLKSLRVRARAEITYRIRAPKRPCFAEIQDRNSVTYC